mmetsp:Transcript_23569/g.22712  ORF Transcript_23569/g.22712 Transcript_23569/m.22712 type:complete len:83 (+) Transcript_23569:216-464(+)
MIYLLALRKFSTVVTTNEWFIATPTATLQASNPRQKEVPVIEGKSGSAAAVVKRVKLNFEYGGYLKKKSVAELSSLRKMERR